MIVTRTWLEKYIDLDGISNDELYETLNRIGLEVESLKEYKIPEKVVVGRIVACNRHPDADKLSLCTIDIGDGKPKQIICGAANVADAEYVAVATIGAVLPDGLEIKPVKLRGVESFGMVCSSEELGLPKINNGIMILDDSIGELEVGREIGSYPRIADTVIELELTANRGDCLSVYGVARDLSAAFDRPLKKISPDKPKSNNIGIARKVDIRSQKGIPSDLIYVLAEGGGLRDRLAISLRLAFVGIEPGDKLENIVRYSTHATGVILHAYDAQKIYDESGRIRLDIRSKDKGQVAVAHGSTALSIVGLACNEDYAADDNTEEVLFEASYIDPKLLVETVAENKLKTDQFYYNTSRGSEPDLDLGIEQLQYICGCAGECVFYEGDIRIKAQHEKRTVSASVNTINAIIGDKISKTTIFTILNRLGFEIHGQGDTFGVHIPPHRHDIVNLHDITEEIIRMVGIDNIKAKALKVLEKNRLNYSAKLFHIKRDMRQRAVAAGFYEAVTYAFADRSSLEKYGFETIDEKLEIVNPIVDELDTLRTTLLTNLLDATRRNVNYGIKKIALFEIGAVFDKKRSQSDKVAFVWSGQREADSILNQGKPANIDFGTFVDRLARVIGEFDLVSCEESNALVHPYQSSNIVVNGKKAGWISKLHPSVAKELNLKDTYISEMDLSLLLPRHILARPVSNYQGVYKDISVLVERSMPYNRLRDAVDELDLPLLKKLYVIDVYEDDSLQEKKSVTIRLFLQSTEGTLSDKDIESSIESVLKILEDRCQARLR